jgi:NAD(P)-dependent dehydrogenase (short-subunit alcohol dehydrogenase family)
VSAALARGDKVLASFRNLPNTQTSSPPDEATTHKNNLRYFQLDLDWDTTRITKAVNGAISSSGWQNVDYLVNNAGFVYQGISEEGG